MNLDQGFAANTAPPSFAEALKSAAPRLELGRLRDNAAD